MPNNGWKTFGYVVQLKLIGKARSEQANYNNSEYVINMSVQLDIS